MVWIGKSPLMVSLYIWKKMDCSIASHMGSWGLLLPWLQCSLRGRYHLLRCDLEATKAWYGAGKGLGSMCVHWMVSYTRVEIKSSIQSSTDKRTSWHWQIHTIPSGLDSWGVQWKSSGGLQCSLWTRGHQRWLGEEHGTVALQVFPWHGQLRLVASLASVLFEGQVSPFEMWLGSN